jgi:hypothetical protein
MGQRESIFGRRKRAARRLAAIDRQVDEVLAELREDEWTDRKLALPGDRGPALRVVVCPDGDAVFVVAIAEQVTQTVVARTSLVSDKVAERRRATIGSLGVVVTSSPVGETGVLDGVVLTGAEQLAETLRFEAARLSCGL